MATDREVFLTGDQRSELNSIAQSRSLPAGYVFRSQAHSDAGRRGIVQHDQAAATNDGSHDHPLETTFPRIGTGRARHLSSRSEGYGVNSCLASPDSVGYPQ